MKQVVLPSGTDPAATGDFIVKSQLLKLKDFREKTKDENEMYIKDHPEFKTLMDNFVSAIISEKPNDIIKFGAYYFKNIKTSSTGYGHAPIIFCGPVGVGKGTLIQMLKDKFPYFGFSISHTTRPPRPGEENGLHYHFISKLEMEEAIDRGEFAEYARIHSNLYGTTYKSIELVRSQGKICLIGMNIEGLKNVRQSKLDFKSIFIAPPSLNELERRIKEKKSDAMEGINIKQQLAIAESEIQLSKEADLFDAIIINDHLMSSFQALVNTIQGWYFHLDLYIEKKNEK